MAEAFLMILEGGPFPREYHAPAGLTWPLPERIMAEGHDKGVYKKTFESKGKPSADGDIVRLRGAKYIWDEDEDPYELSE